MLSQTCALYVYTGPDCIGVRVIPVSRPTPQRRLQLRRANARPLCVHFNSRAGRSAPSTTLDTCALPRAAGPRCCGPGRRGTIG